MIVLEAFSKTDGYAIIRTPDTLRLVKPPYTDGAGMAVPDVAISEAVNKYGYILSGQSMNSWSHAIGFLKEQIVEAWPTVESGISLQECVDLAPDEVITSHLQEIATSLNPAIHIEFVLAVLNGYKNSGRHSLVESAIELLKSIYRSNRSPVRIVQPAFTSLVKSGMAKEADRLAQQVKQTKSIFALAD